MELVLFLTNSVQAEFGDTSSQMQCKAPFEPNETRDVRVIATEKPPLEIIYIKKNANHPIDTLQSNER